MEIMSDKSNDTPIRPTVEEIPAFLINGKKSDFVLTTLFLIAVLLYSPFTIKIIILIFSGQSTNFIILAYWLCLQAW